MDVTEAQRLIENWAAWTQDADPHVWFPTRANFARLYNPDDSDRDGDATLEPPRTPVNANDAKRADAIIQAMTEHHRLVIAWHYLRHGYLFAVACNTFRRHAYTEMELARDAAIRAFADTMESARCTC